MNIPGSEITQKKGQLSIKDFLVAYYMSTMGNRLLFITIELELSITYFLKYLIFSSTSY